MSASALLQRLLQMQGVHWLATRVGSTKLRRLTFDGRFRTGIWDFSTESPGLVRLVEQYSAGGQILVLGCGSCPIAGMLDPATFGSFIGVDLSQEALARAGRFASEKVHFELADMVSYRVAGRPDVVLFSDSLYYAPPFTREKLLRRLCGELSPRGRIIVAIAQPRRYAGLIEMIRAQFSVELDSPLEGEGGRHVLVFR
jgi:trans-aconitate methyltransferase